MVDKGTQTQVLSIITANDDSDFDYKKWKKPKKLSEIDEEIKKNIERLIKIDKEIDDRTKSFFEETENIRKKKNNK